MNNHKCRPLLKASLTQDQSFLDLPYEYTVEDINIMKTYLPKGVEFMGMDFVDNVQEFPKLKNKILSVNSTNPKTKQKLVFKPLKNYEVFCWELSIATNIPKISSEHQKFISQKIIDNIVLMKEQKNRTYSLIKNQMIDLKQLSQTFLFLQQFGHQNIYHGNYLLTKIPVQVLIPKNEKIPFESLMQYIRNDIAYSLRIMLENQLYVRVIKYHKNVIPLQNYYENENQGKKDKNLMKFCEQSQEKMRKPQSKIQSSNSNDKKQNPLQKQQILLSALLICIVAAYLMIKIYL